MKKEKVLALSEDLELMDAIVQPVVIIPYDKFVIMVYDYLIRYILKHQIYHLLDVLAKLRMYQTSQLESSFLCEVANNIKIFDNMIQPYIIKGDAIMVNVLMNDHHLYPMYKLEFLPENQKEFKALEV